MKLSSDAAVLRLLQEGLTIFDSLTDFDKKSLEQLPSVCKETIPAIATDVPNGIAAENEIAGANISSISVRSMTTANMHYANVLLRILKLNGIPIKTFVIKMHLQYL